MGPTSTSWRPVPAALLRGREEADVQLLAQAIWYHGILLVWAADTSGKVVRMSLRGSQTARESTDYYGSAETSLRLPQLPRTARILPRPPPEFASVYSRRRRNRYDAEVGASPRQVVSAARSTMADTQAIASDRWKSQKTMQLSSESAPHGQFNVAPGTMSSGASGLRKRNVHNFPLWETQKFREEHALREGRAIQDDRFWANVKEEHKTKRPAVLAGPNGELVQWDKKVKPWIRQRHNEKKSYMDKRLRRARREKRELEAKQAEMKDQLYRKGKKMLKDIDFLVERKLEGMDTRDDDWLAAHTDAHHFHAAKDKILADKQGGISRGDICNPAVASAAS